MIMTTSQLIYLTEKWQNFTWWDSLLAALQHNRVYRYKFTDATLLLNHNIEKNYVVFQVSDASGKMQVTLVSEENPFSQSHLLTDECFILDHGKSKMIFVWKGVYNLTL